MIQVGCCGWGFMRPRDFFGDSEAAKFKSILQAYAALFPCVEINSTFYRIPKLSTAEKWRKNVDEINKDFEFTVKATQIITHKIRFTKASARFFGIMKDVCKKLDAKILLLQSPSSFKATDENIKRMKEFFDAISAGNLLLAWEMRGDWQKKPELIKEVCKDFNLIQCVDPFRNELIWPSRKKIAYFRLHGLGIISMYQYNFSENELKELKAKISALKNNQNVKNFYVMFNNATMYENALQFMKLITK